MIALLLLGCTGTVDLNLVLVDGADLAVTSARADVDQIVLTTCKGREDAVPLGYAFDLRTPTPVRVPDRRWCTAEVTFLPTQRPLALRGRTTVGTDFDVLVAPERVQLEGLDVGGRGDELVLVLHADRMVSAEEIDALADDEGFARIGAGSPAAGDAVVRLPGALELVTLGEAILDPAFPYPQDWFVERPPIETAWPADTGTWDTGVGYYYGDTGVYDQGSGGCGGAGSEAPEGTDAESGDPGSGSGCSCGDDEDSEGDSADTAVASMASRSGSLAALLLFVRRRRAQA